MLFRAVIITNLIMGFNFGSGVQKPLKMTVYYKSWNDDSTDFIVKQLYTVWKALKVNLQLHMVPISITQQTYHNGHMVFKCHGGPRECEVNALHVCVYHVACLGLEQINCPTEQMTKALDCAKCMMQSKNQKKASKRCARKFNLPSGEIKKCARGWVGETLQSFYANMTINDLPLAKMELPHIVIDTYIDYSQEYARTNLMSLICGHMPDTCWDLNKKL